MRDRISNVRDIETIFCLDNVVCFKVLKGDLKP